jgi:hypothetical protein
MMICEENQMTYFARREMGYVETDPGDTWTRIEFNRRWVVRDAGFRFVDCGAYRNDLKERYPGLLVVDNQ